LDTPDRSSLRPIRARKAMDSLWEVGAMATAQLIREARRGKGRALADRLKMGQSAS
jgi:hypothetical protein